MSEHWKDYQVTVPKGDSCDWCVDTFTVSKHDSRMDQLRGMFSGHGRYCVPGTFRRLMCGRTVVMSDTRDEIHDHMHPIWKAGGARKCLINGLGLGVVLQGILRIPSVKRVDVVELSPDVNALVAPHYREMFGERFNLIQADALEYKPPRGERYDVVWHDIWNDICSDNLKEMGTLHRKYGRRTDWQGSWCRGRCEVQARRDRRYSYC